MDTLFEWNYWNDYLLFRQPVYCYRSGWGFNWPGHGKQFPKLYGGGILTLLLTELYGPPLAYLLLVLIVSLLEKQQPDTEGGHGRFSVKKLLQNCLYYPLHSVVFINWIFSFILRFHFMLAFLALLGVAGYGLAKIYFAVGSFYIFFVLLATAILTLHITGVLEMIFIMIDNFNQLIKYSTILFLASFSMYLIQTLLFVIPDNIAMFSLLVNAIFYVFIILGDIITCVDGLGKSSPVRKPCAVTAHRIFSTLSSVFWILAVTTVCISLNSGCNTDQQTENKLAEIFSLLIIFYIIFMEVSFLIRNTPLLLQGFIIALLFIIISAVGFGGIDQQIVSAAIFSDYHLSITLESLVNTCAIALFLVFCGKVFVYHFAPFLLSFICLEKFIESDLDSFHMFQNLCSLYTAFSINQSHPLLWKLCVFINPGLKTELVASYVKLRNRKTSHDYQRNIIDVLLENINGKLFQDFLKQELEWQFK